MNLIQQYHRRSFLQFIIFALLVSEYRGYTPIFSGRPFHSQSQDDLSTRTFRLASSTTEQRNRVGSSMLPGVLLGKVKAPFWKQAAVTLSDGYHTAERISYSPIGWQLAFVALAWIGGPHGCNTLCSLVAQLSHFQSWYFALLQTHPMITTSVTSGIIGLAGDYAAQWFQHRHKSSSGTFSIRSGTYNLRRGLSNLADGVFLSGPLMHLGYGFFERVLPVSTASSQSLAAMSHVAADIFLMDTFFVATTMIVTGLFEGYHRIEILNQLKQDYVATLKASWATSLLLVPLQFVCFRFLPVSFRVIAMNVANIIWGAVVSLMAHRNRGTPLRPPATVAP